MGLRRQSLTSATMVAFLLALLAVWQRPATAQSAPARAAAAAVPRLPDGHPDLQGVYDLATLTPLERPAVFADRLTLTDQQARQLEGAVAARKERASLPDRGDRPAPPIGGDGSSGAAGNVGGYNNFWIDNGTSYVIVDGQKRTSVIIDPPNGRVPAPTAAARQRQASRVVRTTSDEQRSEERRVGKECRL